MKNTIKLTNTDLDNVYGGTFWPNMFEEEDYHKMGIRTSYHTFTYDEFWLPDGTKTDENGANEYIRSVDPDFYDRRRIYVNPYC